MKVSLIIPAYNEEERINSTLNEYYTAFINEFDDFELIVEMDGCTDKTADIVDDFSRDKVNIEILEFDERFGKGGGLKMAFLAAKGDVVGFTDADNSTNFKEIIKMIRILESNDMDVVVGQRYGGINQIPIVRVVFSRGFNMLVRLLFQLNMRDTQCGAKVFRKEVIDKLLPDLVIDDYSFDVNFLYSANKMGFNIKEVDIEWRCIDGSKIRLFSVTINMFLSLIKLRLYYSPLRSLVKMKRGLQRQHEDFNI